MCGSGEVRGVMLEADRGLRDRRLRGCLVLVRIRARVMICAATAEGRIQNASVGSRSHSGRCGPLFT